LLRQRAQNEAAAALANLAADLGGQDSQPYQLLEPPAISVPDTNDVSQLVETALRYRPELLSLRNEDSAALQFAKSQRDARLPTIAAFGVAGVSPDHDKALSHDYAAAGLQLSLPLFAGGYYTARQREAELKSQADQELLRAAEDNIVRDVHVAWLNLNDAAAQLQTTGELVRNAAEAYQLADARYKIGSSSIVELSQAQLNLTSAQIAETTARYRLLIEEANLSYQVGALSVQ
jgi:outer membrane protein